MAFADADGVKLYYEETGSGTPIVFVHEFATDHRGWEPQMVYFARRHRCIAFNAQGYPPANVPGGNTKRMMKVVQSVVKNKTSSIASSQKLISVRGIG